jgi:hypothetical protein
MFTCLNLYRRIYALIIVCTLIGFSMYVQSDDDRFMVIGRIVDDLCDGANWLFMLLCV